MTATAGTSFGSFRPFSLNAGTGARKADRKLRRRHAADPANEAFEAHRRAIVCAGNRVPLERVAAFLVAISKNNRHEGRHPNAIPDSLTCGFVADLLGFPIATLVRLLKVIEERGFIAPDSHAGLLLKDLPALERLARA